MLLSLIIAISMPPLADIRHSAIDGYYITLTDIDYYILGPAPL
jgi:hypothetical protein